jgi:hypothetical protein
MMLQAGPAQEAGGLKILRLSEVVGAVSEGAR